MLLFRFNYF